MEVTSILLLIFVLYYCAAVNIARLIVLVSCRAKLKLLFGILKALKLKLILHLTCVQYTSVSSKFSRLIMVEVLHHRRGVI